MEPTTLSSAPPPAASAATPQGLPEPAQTDAPPTAARLDLSRLEPPRQLAEARLEEVTIDGICGVY